MRGKKTMYQDEKAGCEWDWTSMLLTPTRCVESPVVPANDLRTLVLGLGVSENCFSSKRTCSRVRRALGKSSGSVVTVSSPVELMLQAEPRRDRDKGIGEDGSTQDEEEVTYVGNRDGDEDADEDNDEAKRFASCW